MIVSNSTPISNLLHIKHVHLLQKLFKEVYIPDAVADELNVFFKGSRDFQDCLSNNHIIIKKVESVHFVKHMTPYLEIDSNKDKGGSNPEDHNLFLFRVKQCFDGLVEQDELDKLDLQYRIEMRVPDLSQE